MAIAQLGVEIREDEQDSAMMAQRTAILEALKALDLVVERQAGCSKGDAAWGNVLFTQPGMGERNQPRPTVTRRSFSVCSRAVTS